MKSLCVLFSSITVMKGNYNRERKAGHRFHNPIGAFHRKVDYIYVNN